MVILGLGCLSALAAEMVGVSGSDAQFPAVIESKVGDKQVKLRLTGTALRKKFIFSIYAIGSYLQEDDPARTAEALAVSDSPKQLHLVLERDVDGKDMVAALKDAIRKSYPEDAFATEMTALGEFFQGNTIKKGDNVRLTHVPGLGLHCAVFGKSDVLIKNPNFSRAIWDIYLGKNNLGEAIKQGLVSRL
jgi:hypothetical protein